MLDRTKSANNNKDINGTRSAYGIKAGIFGMIINFVLFIAKLAAGILSGGIAVMADAFNNLSDFGSSVITLFGFKLASRPADKEHPFGHGRMEYMSALAVSMIIILVGVELIKSSVEKIFHPEMLDTGVLIYVVLILSIVLKLIMGCVYAYTGKKINSLALKAAKADSFTDCIATGAVLVSSVMFDAFNINIDAYIGLAVAVMIIVTGVKSVKETLDPLIGQPPSRDVTDKIKAIALSYDNILDIHGLTIHSYGAGRAFASLHAVVPQDMGLVECHEMVDMCEQEIELKLGIHALIHIDPTGTKDVETLDVKARVQEIIGSINPSLTIVDFRLYKDEQKMLFDIFVPVGVEFDRNVLESDAEERVKREFAGYIVKANAVMDT